MSLQESQGENGVGAASKTKTNSPLPAATPAPKFGMPPGAVAVVAGVLVAGALIGVLKAENPPAAGQGGKSVVAKVALTELDAVTPSLEPAQADALKKEAGACKTPLARLVLSKVDAKGLGTVRIRSGGYLSPALALTDAPRVVAVPFPAPYESGAGHFTIEGNATEASLSLTPPVNMPNLAGAQVIPVWWTVEKNCR